VRVKKQGSTAVKTRKFHRAHSALGLRLADKEEYTILQLLSDRVLAQEKWEFEVKGESAGRPPIGNEGIGCIRLL